MTRSHPNLDDRSDLDALRDVADSLRAPDLDELLGSLRVEALAERDRERRSIVRPRRTPRRRTWRLAIPVAVAAVAVLTAVALAPDDDRVIPAGLRLDQAEAEQVLLDAAQLVEREPRFSRASGPWLATTTESLLPDGTPDPELASFSYQRSWIGPDGRTLDIAAVDFEALSARPSHDTERLGRRYGITLRDASGSLRAIEYAPGSSEPLARSEQSGLHQDALIAGVPAQFVRGLPADEAALDAYLPTFITLPGGVCHGLPRTACPVTGPAEQVAVGAAINLLERAPIDAPQRSALYRYLARHARSGRAGVTDFAGRRGIALTFDIAFEQRSEVVLDPETGVVLQVREWNRGEEPRRSARVLREQEWVDAPRITDNADACGGAGSCDVLERLRELEQAAAGTRLPEGHFFGDGVVATQGPARPVPPAAATSARR